MGGGGTVGHDPQIKDYPILSFYKSKIEPKRQKARIFRAKEKYGVCRWIGNEIIAHFDDLKFEIGPLEAEKIIFSNVV